MVLESYVYICGFKLFLWENSQNPVAAVAKCSIVTSECTLIQTEFPDCQQMVITENSIFVANGSFLNIYEEGNITQWVAVEVAQYQNIGLWKGRTK